MTPSQDEANRNPRKPLWFCLLFGFFTALLTPTMGAATFNVQAQGGSLDVAGWDPKELRALYGDWYFAGQELLTPEMFLRMKDAGRIFHTTQIGLSLEQSDPEKIKGPLGYGTYILHLKNLPPDTLFAMAEIVAYTSARIYFFDHHGHGWQEPLWDMGFVSPDPKHSRSEMSIQSILPFRTYQAGDGYILIQVANHHHAWGGLWYPPTVGLLPVVLSEMSATLTANAFVFGVMVFIGFYNFMLFMYRREDRGSLYLAAVCATLLARTWIFTNYGQDYFGDGYWGVQFSFKVIYATLFTLPWAAFHSAQNFFPRQTPAWMQKLIPRFCILCLIFVLLTPSRIFAVYGNGLFLLGVGLGTCSAYIAARAAMARETGSLIVVLGIVAVLLASLLEFLNALNLIQAGRNAMTFGMTVYAASLSLIVSKRFAQAFRQAEHLSQELHSEVQRQTREIRSLLDNLNQGIFTLVAGTHRVGSQFSAALRHIVGFDQIEGRSLSQLLLDRSDLNSDRKDLAENAVQASLGENLISFELNAASLVREIAYQHPVSGKTQFLELDWSPIYDQNEQVEKLLISVRDVTEITQLREHARQREEDFEILKELVDVAEDRFSRFLNQARLFLQDNQRIMLHPANDDTVQKLFINMHTLKGIARSYNFTLLANAVHLAEDKLSRLRAGQSSRQDLPLENDRQKVEAVCAHYERIAMEKLGWTAEDSTVRMKKAQIETMLEHLQKAAQTLSPGQATEDLVALEMELLTLCYQTLNQVLDEAARGLDSLARSLGKLPPNLQITGHPAIVTPDTAAVIHGTFTHLFRNSLDHGLETADLRVAAGKPSQGLIRITWTLYRDGLRITYEDDGRGLDLSALQQKAQEQGLIKENARASSQELANLIFVAGLSTKQEVTDTSGRGVGMDAVRSMFQEIDGDVAIELSPTDDWKHRKFRLILQLPLHRLIQGVIDPGAVGPASYEKITGF